MTRLAVTEKIISTKVSKGLSWADVAMDTGTRAYALRREMEQLFAR